MNTKSVMAGEYTAPPAQGPIIAEICGTTPEASVLRRKISAYAPRLTTPSWIRAPPESLRPITGAPFFMARSITLQICLSVLVKAQCFPLGLVCQRFLYLIFHCFAERLRVARQSSDPC